MLELKKIVKKFGERTIINRLNLKVEKGQILAIVGPSGGGKTTLLRCISGLEKIDSGSFYLDGQQIDPTHLSNEQTIGVVFQDFQLFPHLSVLENITLAPVLNKMLNKSEAQKTAAMILEQLNLTQQAQQYPHQLSGGQKQRVALARALIMKPSILCYDEPTSALDPDLRKQVENLILSLKPLGMIQIVVTHDLSFAENIADQLLKVNPL